MPSRARPRKVEEDLMKPSPWASSWRKTVARSVLPGGAALSSPGYQAVTAQSDRPTRELKRASNLFPARVQVAPGLLVGQRRREPVSAVQHRGSGRAQHRGAPGAVEVVELDVHRDGHLVPQRRGPERCGVLRGDEPLLPHAGSGVAPHGGGRGPVVQPLAAPVPVDDADLGPGQGHRAHAQGEEPEHPEPGEGHRVSSGPRTSAAAPSSLSTQPTRSVPSSAR